MMYESVFGQGSDGAEPPDLDKIEEYYWRLVTNGTEHVCVHSAAVDTGEEGYGFTKNKSDPYGRHPWNPKVHLCMHYTFVDYIMYVVDFIIALSVPKIFPQT